MKVRRHAIVCRKYRISDMYLVITFNVMISIGEYNYEYRRSLLESLCMHTMKNLVASRKQQIIIANKLLVDL